MIASGNFLRVQINFEAFWEKPPLFFWLQVASMQLFGITEFAARFPNALFGFLYLITFYLIGKKHFGCVFGLSWALLFYASLLPHLYFKSGIIDPVFNYFIFLSIYFMIRAFNRDNLYFAFLSGGMSGLSILTKGPVGFLLLFLTFAVYISYNRFRKLPTIQAMTLFIAGLTMIVTLWIGMEVNQNGWSVIQRFISYQAELFSTPVAGHKQPFYYHFVVVFLGCFPISILALPMFRSKMVTSYDFRIWMLSLFWVVMILFSLSSTKIIHYSSMSYAPLSFLAALSLHNLPDRKSFSKILRSIYLVVGLLIALIITCLPLVIYKKEALFPYIKDPFAVASLKTAVHWSGFEFLIGIFYGLFVIAGYILLKRGVYKRFLMTSVMQTAFTLLLVLFFILPKVEQYTQGPLIDFCERYGQQDVYLERYGFKSYVPYYYGKVPPGRPKHTKDMDWLLNGKIDKPVYLVSKITNTELKDHPEIEFLGTKGGYNFYRRLPKD